MTQPVTDPPRPWLSAADKLLSHRLRGFGAPEHSPVALRAAASSQVPYLEVDTRASADGTIFVHHDPIIRATSGRVRIAGARAEDVRGLRHANGEALLTLADALAIFQRRARAEQRLCLDIKDLGFEAEHLALVREAGLEDSVVWVSWIPQALMRLAELGTRAPLMLSHANLLQYPLLAWFSRPWRRSVRRYGRFVLLGPDRHTDPLDALTHGYQHSLVSDVIPSDLIDVLAASGGGVCLHYLLGGSRVGEFCARHGLAMWLFTARNTRHFMRLAARDDVAVVFSDDAPAVQHAIR